MNTTFEKVKAVIEDVAKRQGGPVPKITKESKVLQETGLDSLALAEVLVKLEGVFQKDPFQNGFINFSTVEELARLYES